MASEARVEELTRRIGREIFARVSDIRPIPLGPTWWDDQLMQTTMGDEAVKVQLFRFVDVLPQLACHVRAPYRSLPSSRRDDRLYPFAFSSLTTMAICWSGSSIRGMLAAPRWPPPP